MAGLDVRMNVMSRRFVDDGRVAIMFRAAAGVLLVSARIIADIDVEVESVYR